MTDHQARIEAWRREVAERKARETAPCVERKGLPNGSEPKWITVEDIDRYEAAQRDKAPVSNGHVRAPPKAPAEPKGYYTKVPNWLFDIAAEKDLDASSTVALFQICRLSHGMHRPTTVISVEHLAVRCNFSPATCKRALNELVDKGLIRREKRTDKGGRDIASELGLVLDT